MENDAIQPRIKFNKGDVISHPTLGLGEVVDIIFGEDSRIVIKYFNNPNEPKRITPGIADSSVTKIAQDSFEFQALRNKNTLVNWATEAPLRLVALAIGKPGWVAKTSQIKTKIESQHILDISWNSWWKKTQPSIKTSPYFRIGAKGDYELLVAYEGIPLIPLMKADKKKETVLPPAQLKDILNKLLAGEVKFNDIQGAKNKHNLTKQLVKLLPEKEVWASISAGLKGPSRNAGILLNEMIKKAKNEDIAVAFEILLDNVADLLLQVASDSEVPGHFVSTVDLFTSSLAVWLKRIGKEGQTHLVPLVPKLIELVKSLASYTSNWREKASNLLTHSLVDLAVFDPEVLLSIIRAMKSLPVEIASNSIVATLKMIPVEKGLNITRLIMATVLEQSGDLADEIIRKSYPQQGQITWWSNNISELSRFTPININQAIGQMLGHVGIRTSSEYLDAYCKLVLAAYLAFPELIIPEISREKIRQWTDGFAIHATRGIEDPLNLIVTTYLKIHSLRWEQEKSALSAELKNQREQNEEQMKEIDNLNHVISELKTGYHKPERWTEYGAKNEMLERIGQLYQKIQMSESDQPLVKWILNQLEHLVIRNGANFVGIANEIVEFIPFEHQVVRGFESSDKPVKIRYPGFAIKDPDGNMVVLVKALVER